MIVGVCGFGIGSNIINKKINSTEIDEIRQSLAKKGYTEDCICKAIEEIQ